MTKEEIRLATPEQVLPQLYRNVLSYEAAQVYAACWYRGAAQNRAIQVIPNDDMIRRARIPLSKMEPAIDELVNAGLIQYDPLNRCARYEMLPLPELDADQTDEQLWASYSTTL